MDVIQTNYLNNILKEMKILSPFHNAARTAGIEWHGGKVNKYFMHISPILAVIAAFPVDKQTEIDVDTFDILNYRWISTCLSNGWAGKSFSGFTAAEVCDAIDALYGIRKYSNGEWPNFEYNKILTCTSIINFARKTGKLQGEIDENNWQYIHDICIEGISRREAKIQEMNVNYRRHSVEALESALSVVDDESAKAEASSMVDKVDYLVKEEEERKQKEEERLRKEEDRKKAEEEVEMQKKAIADFEAKKKLIVNNLKTEIGNLRTSCIGISKVFNTKLNNNPEDLSAASDELNLLVGEFILLNQRKSLLIEISKKSYGDSLDDFDSNNSNENKSAEDELSVKQSGCRIPDNVFSIRSSDSSWQITFSKCFSKRLADGGYRYASAYCVSGTYYIEFYKNFPLCACSQLNVSITDECTNARINSKSLVLDIFKKLNISSSVGYARLQFSATDTPSQTIRVKVIRPTKE